MSARKAATKVGTLASPQHNGEESLVLPHNTTSSQALPSHKDDYASGIREGAPLGHSGIDLERIMNLKRDKGETHLADTDFDRITQLLVQDNKVEWSLRPRTYAVLNMIDAIELMHIFVELDCWDIALPYTEHNLPKELSEETRGRFLMTQSVVLTKAASIEGGLNLTHANFVDSVDRHLKPLEMLGKGGFGTVLKVRSKLSGKKYARKQFDRAKTFEGDIKALKSFKNEIDNMKRLQHRHLIRYVGSYTDPKYIGIVMEPIAEMDLQNFLTKRSFHVSEYDCIRQAFGCLCAALIYLNEQKCRHKDIKPKNILVRQGSMYITDFSLARDWTALSESKTTGEVGPQTWPYAAPEVFRHDSRGSPSDIWSLGCVYLDMIVRLPYTLLL